MSEENWYTRKELPPVGTECVLVEACSMIPGPRSVPGTVVTIVAHDDPNDGSPVAVYGYYCEDASCVLYHGLIAGYFKPLED
jgi:hypothetical protein